MTVVRFPAGHSWDTFFLRHCVQINSKAHPDSYLMVTGALSPRAKRPRREADHSPTTSAYFKDAWSYTSILPYILMGT
jgi:hypothetical protein